MKIYNYDKRTKEYINSTNARENPMVRGEYLLPANATFIEPKDKENIFDGDKWIYKEDNRSKIVYNKKTLQPKTVDYLGIIDNNYTLLKPISNCDEWINDNWVTDLDKYKIYINEQINIFKENKKYKTPIEYKTFFFDSDKSSLEIIGYTILSYKNPTTITKLINAWWDIDNKSELTLLSDLIGLYNKIILQINSETVNARTTKDNILKCEDKDSIDKIFNEYKL